MHKYLFILLLSILIMVSPLLGNTSRSHTGGPDGFGYMWIDSDTTGGPVFQWVNATDGTIIGTGDDEYFTVPIDFTFNYYGFDYDTVYVGTNGIIGFGSHLGINVGFNSSIPTESNVEIDIHGIDGRSFGTLFSGNRKSGVYHTDLNKKLSTGIYFIQLKAKTSTNIYKKTAKLIVL